MTFLQPEALLLLVVVAAGAIAGARLRPGPGTAVRATVLALLCLALARPALRLPDQPQTVVFLVDTSDSVPESEQQRALAEAQERAAALPEDATSHVLRFDTVVHGGSGAHTDLSGAIQAALHRIPGGQQGRIVVFTDGRNTGADLSAVLAEAAARQVGISAEALDPGPLPAGPGLLDFDRDAAPGETVPATVLLHGGVDGYSGPLTVSLGGTALLQQDVTLAAGARETLPLAVPLPGDVPDGLAAVTVQLGGAEAVGHVLVRKPPAVLLVGDRRGDTRPLQALLEAEGMRVSTSTPRSAPGELGPFDVVVLADTPVEPPEAGGSVLSPALLSALDGYVRDGGGLLVLGGERSYDLGGWDGSLLEPLLPLRIDPDGALKDDAVTLVIAMDKSGSMARPAVPVQYATGLGRAIAQQSTGGRPVGSKIRLADEGAIAATELLREKDRIGVLTIDSVAKWAVPLQALQSRAAVKQRILQIGAGGGGINLMTALEAGYDALKVSDTPIRHMVLFADSAGISERRRGAVTALDLVGQYEGQDITLSVVGIGGPQSRDAEYLKELADSGGGRMYLTDDARELPALFTQETERLMGAGVEEEVAIQAKLAQWHPALRGVNVAGAPALRGINPVLPQRRARMLLTTTEGAPLLAVWRVGLGEVAASASDAGARWSGRWLRWSGYAKLYTQLVRHLAAPDSSAGAVLAVTADGPEAVARLTTLQPSGLSAEVEGLTLTRAGADGERQPIAAQITAPGTWEARWETPPGTLWTVSAEDRSGERLASVTWASPSSPEAQWRTPDPDTLAALDQPAAAPAASWRAADLAPWLLGLVALLLPIDAFLRTRRR